VGDQSATPGSRDRAARIKPPKGSKGGKPRVELSADEIEKFIAIGHTFADAAEYFEVAPKTLYNERKRRPELDAAAKRGLIRRKERIWACLWSQARAGNVTAAIYLDKKWGGGLPPERLEHTGADGGPLQIQLGRAKVEERLRKLQELARRKADRVPGTRGAK
jgi:hypothetical protein